MHVRIDTYMHVSIDASMHRHMDMDRHIDRYGAMAIAPVPDPSSPAALVHLRVQDLICPRSGCRCRDLRAVGVAILGL